MDDYCRLCGEEASELKLLDPVWYPMMACSECRQKYEDGPSGDDPFG